MSAYDGSDATSVPESALAKLNQVAALVDPLVRSMEVTLPIGPDNDLPYLTLNITTEAIINTSATGRGLIVMYPGLPFSKVLEHYVIDNLDALQQGEIIQLAVNPAKEFTAGRTVLFRISLAANYLSNIGGITSATVQGKLGGTEVTGGLSQLYQAGVATGKSFSMEALSQLIANPTMKLTGLNATEGIAYQAPPQNGEFIRLSDQVPLAADVGVNENLDWSLPNVVSVRQGLQDAPGWANQLDFAIGEASKEFKLPAISVDAPYHMELTMMLEGLLTSFIGGNASVYFNFDLYADVYDLTRLEANKRSYQFRAFKTPSNLTNVPVWATMVKVLPDEDVDEVHYTWSAVAWRLVVSRTQTTTAQSVVFAGPPSVATKVYEPLYLGRGKAQAPVVFAYAGLPSNAPISISSLIGLEVVPDTNLSKITSPKLRSPSVKTWKLLNHFTNKFQKLGKSWFYAANGVGPYAPRSHSQQIRSILSGVFASHYPQYAHLLTVPQITDNYEFASKATKWFRKLNRRLKKVGSKGLEVVGDVAQDVGKEALDIGKDILRQKVYEAAGADPNAGSIRDLVSSQMRQRAYEAANLPVPSTNHSQPSHPMSYREWREMGRPDGIEDYYHSWPTFDQRQLFLERPDLRLENKEFASGATFASDSFAHRVAKERLRKGPPTFSSKSSLPLLSDDFETIGGDSKSDVQSWYSLACDTELKRNPRVFALSETCIADSDYTMTKKGDLWCLTYPTPKLMSWLANFGVKYEPRNQWSRLGQNCLIGHVGENFAVPGLKRDVVLLHVARRNPLQFDYIGPGRGDSLTLALYALAAAKCAVNMAFTGPVVNNFVVDIPISTLHAKVLAAHDIPVVANANGMFNTVPIANITTLPILMRTFETRVGAHYFSGKGESAPPEVLPQRVPKEKPKNNPKPAAKNRAKAAPKQGGQPRQDVAQVRPPRGQVRRERSPFNDLLTEITIAEGTNLFKTTSAALVAFRQKVYGNLARLMFPTGRWAFSSPRSAYLAQRFVNDVLSNFPCSLQGSILVTSKAVVSALLTILDQFGLVYHSSFSIVESAKEDGSAAIKADCLKSMYSKMGVNAEATGDAENVAVWLAKLTPTQ